MIDEIDTLVAMGAIARRGKAAESVKSMIELARALDKPSHIADAEIYRLFERAELGIDGRAAAFRILAAAVRDIARTAEAAIAPE